MERISHRLIMLKPMRAGADGYARAAKRGRPHAFADSCARPFRRRNARLLVRGWGRGAHPRRGPRERARRGCSHRRGTGGRFGSRALAGADPGKRRGGARAAAHWPVRAAKRGQPAGREERRAGAVRALIPQQAQPQAAGNGVPHAAGDGPAARTYAQALPEKPAGKSKTAEAAPMEAAHPKPEGPPLPREIFLPAIDPLPYVTAQSRPMAEAPETGDEGEAAAPTDGQDGAEPGMEAFLHSTALRRGAPAVNRLRPLEWPRGFDRLAGYFAKGMPCRLFDLPGWRFVNAAQAGGPQGLWVGVQRQDGRVSGVAYAHRGKTPPPGGRLYRAARGLDGETYQVLWQKFR